MYNETAFISFLSRFLYKCHLFTPSKTITKLFKYLPWHEAVTEMSLQLLCPTLVWNMKRFFNDFRSHSGLRTVEIVRKEIQELEDLMNGKKILSFD